MVSTAYEQKFFSLPGPGQSFLPYPAVLLITLSLVIIGDRKNIAKNLFQLNYRSSQKASGVYQLITDIILVIEELPLILTVNNSGLLFWHAICLPLSLPHLLVKKKAWLAIYRAGRINSSFQKLLENLQANPSKQQIFSYDPGWGWGNGLEASSKLLQTEDIKTLVFSNR